ncbi:cyclic lactone autoinducer peptide [Enterococcus sp. BWB1-3]|nr:cyclic lactone autoinducer peptide [Enterococcus sp. BWB1-3]MBL1228780.1 cyclic lactone autoinducer peptide [Enterococcus sp. BWB1-3]
MRKIINLLRGSHKWSNLIIAAVLVVASMGSRACGGIFYEPKREQ